jgi:hypothetical protein
MPLHVPGIVLITATLLLPAALAPSSKDKGDAQVVLVDISLEQKIDDTARAVSADHVFAAGDTVRFRLHSRVTGYLYVSNQSTSGRYETLFPTAQTGTDNRIKAGQDYFVPGSADGWFRVEDPPGFEVLYFLISPAPLAPAGTATGAAQLPGPVQGLMPRCNDAIFKARGECVDANAGPAPAPPDAKLPAELSGQAGSASRDIIFSKQKSGTDVATHGPLTGPVIYTFHLAHK